MNGVGATVQDLEFANLKNDSIDQNDSISPCNSTSYLCKIITFDAKRHSQVSVHNSHNLLFVSMTLQLELMHIKQIKFI